MCFLFEDILTYVSWAQIHAFSIWRQFDLCLLGTNTYVFYLKTSWHMSPRHKYMSFLFEDTTLKNGHYLKAHHSEERILPEGTPLCRTNITWRHTTLKKESSSTCRFSFVLAPSMILFSVNWWISRLTCRSRRKLSRVVTKAFLSSISSKRRTYVFNNTLL